MLKRLIIWIMLIALPLQSYAAASMLYCAPMHQAMTMQTMAPADAHAMHGDNPDADSPPVQHMQHCDMAMAADGDDAADQTPQSHKMTDKCSSCCMCTVAVSPSLAKGLSSSGVAIMAPHLVDTLTSVSLEAQQRPPRTSSL